MERRTSKFSKKCSDRNNRYQLYGKSSINLQLVSLQDTKFMLR